LKTSTFKYTFYGLFFIFLIACSTKKDKFINRNFQALNTEFNVLYNGDIALQKGIADLKFNFTDNYWEILPIERLQITDEILESEKSLDPNFERSEDKAIKAIQKRSMLIGGTERNPQIDEAHLLLGKSRYYSQRFIPALEAFNYILYKYPNSSRIYEAKIWREKTNIRLENDALAVNNLTKLLNEIKFKDQIFSDAHASLAQAYLNLDDFDNAVKSTKLATEFTKSNEEKARYKFILGQLYEKQNYPDSAYAAYQSVINMKRKSPRAYVVHSHIKQAKQFDFKLGDTVVFLKEYNKLIDEYENRLFLDALFHQKAIFYDKQGNDKEAIFNYNNSLDYQTSDKYLVASNYRNIAEIYFYNAEYRLAGNYYDSTLVSLQPRTREYNAIKKKRVNLEDVIKYEAIVTRNDSILNIVSLSEPERKAYFEKYIAEIKKKEEEALRKQEEYEAKQAQSNDNPYAQNINTSSTQMSKPVGISASGNTFYFYNPATVAQGKLDFAKRWGKRKPDGYWRISATNQPKELLDEEDEEVASNRDLLNDKPEKIDPRLTTAFYSSQLPNSQIEIDSIADERNFAYYQLGVIYKEKFKEYQLSANRFELLLDSNPEDRLILPALYNLYKVYEIINPSQAVAIKNQIISQYPNSRYTQILTNQVSGDAAIDDNPTVAYAQLYKMFENGDYRNLLPKLDEAIDKFTGDEIVPKIEFLKANTLGKLKGLGEYKSALNYVSLTYPNVSEGKEAESFLNNRLPQLESLDFNQNDPLSYKILYQADDLEGIKTKVLIEKVSKFIKDRGLNSLKTSIDIYTMEQNFFVMHGIQTESDAKEIVSILKEYKDYKITEPAIVISNENYAVVQIKKNLKDYLNPNYVSAPKKNFAPIISKETTDQKVLENVAPRTKPSKAITSPKDVKQNNELMIDDPQPINDTRSSITPPKGEPKKG
jgi:tetratricopeptide (TPR) repeat protein